MFARPFIDSLDFAENGRQINGEVPVAEMPRLQEMLENSHGILEYSARGNFDNRGIHQLDIGISGCCWLRCQRCLGAMEHEVRIDTRLLLRDQASLDALGDEEEAFDSILADAHLDVLNLLEEEILLSLPIAPMHEPGACQVVVGGDAHEGEESPFAVLAKLKRNA